MPNYYPQSVPAALHSYDVNILPPTYPTTAILAGAGSTVTLPGNTRSAWNYMVDQGLNVLDYGLPFYGNAKYANGGTTGAKYFSSYVIPASGLYSVKANMVLDVTTVSTPLSVILMAASNYEQYISATVAPKGFQSGANAARLDRDDGLTLGANGAICLQSNDLSLDAAADDATDSQRTMQIACDAYLSAGDNISFPVFMYAYGALQGAAQSFPVKSFFFSVTRIGDVPIQEVRSNITDAAQVSLRPTPGQAVI